MSRSPDSSSTGQASGLFGDTDDRVTILIEGKPYTVPPELELLRCFQFLDFDIAFERFCWNASCENCEAKVQGPGQTAQRTLCCQRLSEDGLSVETLPQGVSVK